MRAAPLVLALAAFLPQAGALAALVEAPPEDAHEARFLLRVREGVPLRAQADAPVRLALAAPDAAPEAWGGATLEQTPPPGDWRGLAGVVALVARRDDPGRAVTLLVTQGEEGVLLEWAARVAQVRAPVPAWAPLGGLVLGAWLVGAYLGRRS